MPVPGVGEFVGYLRASQLLDEAQVEDVAQWPAAAGGDARALADELVARDMLSRFQADAILDGHTDFFVGPYTLVDRIGAGGMGKVYKAVHRRMQRLVALKVLPPSKRTDPDARARFMREVHASAKLNHPNIVTAYDVGEEGDVTYLAMEYVPGTSLQVLIRQVGRLAPEQGAEIACQVALALDHAYRRDVVHRDIKPSNILITEDGTAKVLDMGLARFHGADDGLTRQGVIMGTVDYLAPEQAMDSHTADTRADIYSLGCTLYHMLTGRVPFPGHSSTEKLTKHQMQEPTPVTDVAPAVCADLWAVVRRMMAKHKKDRYQTPIEVACALVPWVSASLAATVGDVPSAAPHLKSVPGRASGASQAASAQPSGADTRRAAPTLPETSAPEAAPTPSETPPPRAARTPPDPDSVEAVLSGFFAHLWSGIGPALRWTWRALARAGVACLRQARMAVSYYWSHRAAIRDYLIDHDSGMIPPERYRREIRVSAEDDEERAQYTEQGWDIELPACCVVCGRAVQTEACVETRSVDDMARPFWWPVAGLATGAVLAWLIASWWGLAIGFVAGVLLGCKCRRSTVVTIRFHRCDAHAGKTRYPYLRTFRGQLIIRAGHATVRSEFRQRRPVDEREQASADEETDDRLAPIPLAGGPDDEDVPDDFEPIASGPQEDLPPIPVDSVDGTAPDESAPDDEPATPSHGTLEPVPDAPVPLDPEPARADVPQPQFVGKEQRLTGTYETYRGTDAESAKAFLATKKVDRERYYIVVETPEGNWGVDVKGLYLEKLLPFQTDVDAAECEGRKCGSVDMLGLEMAARGMSDNFVMMVECGQCGHQWRDGLRYQNVTVVRCPKCRTLNRIDTGNIQVHIT